MKEATKDKWSPYDNSDDISYTKYEDRKDVAKEFANSKLGTGESIKTAWTDKKSGKTYIILDIKGTGVINGTTAYSHYYYDKSKMVLFEVSSLDKAKTIINATTSEGDLLESTAKTLRPVVSTWYKSLRAIALVGLLSVLVYIGIRILISSTGQEKAKYKKMVIDWVTAICILFVLQYIMVFTLTATEKIIDVLKVNVIDEQTGRDNLISDLRDEISGNTTEKNNVEIINFTDFQIFTKTIMYLALVIETCVFTVFYLKRLLYMAFFTMIAPLVALTYPIDKIKDGQAQAFSTLIREYIFNALIQPVHLLLYYILVFSAGNLVDQNPLYAVVAIGFMIPAEKFFRKMFGFEKASSVSQVGAAAGGALIMNAINKMRQGGTGGGSKAIGKGQSGGTSGTPTRTASPTNAVEIGTADDGSTGGSGAAGGSGGTPGSLGTTRRANTHGATLARTNSFGNGIKAVRRKYINKNTARTMGRMTRKAAIGGLGGLAAGTVGLAAGVATGDVGNVFKYGAAGAAAGYMGANYAGDKLLSGEKNLRETFKEGAIGQEEYNNLKSDKEFYESDEFRSMLNNPSLMPGEKHRNREMRNAVQVYRDNGITDTGKIAGAMKQELTPQEGAYAIKLAEMIGRSGWNNPKTREDFEKRYKNNMPAGADADKIWKSIESLL